MKFLKKYHRKLTSDHLIKLNSKSLYNRKKELLGCNTCSFIFGEISKSRNSNALRNIPFYSELHALNDDIFVTHKFA